MHRRQAGVWTLLPLASCLTEGTSLTLSVKLVATIGSDGTITFVEYLEVHFHASNFTCILRILVSQDQRHCHCVIGLNNRSSSTTTTSTSNYTMQS